ncbi:MAG: BON domain-containing protein [Gammaproteobacteria bacterium]|nr:BON domain-containing protein [Gammaproteobacteria bacterium]
MRSEQDRGKGMGRERQQHYSPADGEERFEGQYEKDPWRPDWRPDPPRRGGPGFTGGYYRFGAGSRGPDRPERDVPRYPPGPKCYQRSDERLREDIAERLRQAPYIDSSDVAVEVSAAKVVLQGTVPERGMKHAIEDLVDACPGVQDIENRIAMPGGNPPLAAASSGDT